MVIFDNGNGGNTNQTGNTSFANNTLYKANPSGTNIQANAATAVSTVTYYTYTFYYDNSSTKWSSVKAYAYNQDFKPLGTSTACTQTAIPVKGTNLYKITLTNVPGAASDYKIQFIDGSNSSNTSAEATGVDGAIYNKRMKQIGSVANDVATLTVSNYTCYFDNSSTKWSTVKAYTYKSTDYPNGAYPGTACTETSVSVNGKNLVSIDVEDVDSDYKIMFINGSNQDAKTSDVALINDMVYSGTSMRTIGYFKDISVSNVKSFSTYFDNTATAYGTVYAYMYKAGDSKCLPLGPWPGTKCDESTVNITSSKKTSTLYTVAATVDGVSSPGDFILIINDGNSSQTGKIACVSDGSVYANNMGYYIGNVDTNKKFNPVALSVVSAGTDWKPADSGSMQSSISNDDNGNIEVAYTLQNAQINKDATYGYAFLIADASGANNANIGVEANLSSNTITVTPGGSSSGTNGDNGSSVQKVVVGGSNCLDLTISLYYKLSSNYSSTNTTYSYWISVKDNSANVGSLTALASATANVRNYTGKSAQVVYKYNNEVWLNEGTKYLYATTDDVTFNPTVGYKYGTFSVKGATTEGNLTSAAMVLAPTSVTAGTAVSPTTVSAALAAANLGQYVTVKGKCSDLSGDVMTLTSGDVTYKVMYHFKADGATAATYNGSNWSWDTSSNSWITVAPTTTNDITVSGMVMKSGSDYVVYPISMTATISNTVKDITTAAQSNQSVDNSTTYTIDNDAQIIIRKGNEMWLYEAADGENYNLYVTISCDIPEGMADKLVSRAKIKNFKITCPDATKAPSGSYIEAKLTDLTNAEVTDPESVDTAKDGFYQTYDNLTSDGQALEAKHLGHGVCIKGEFSGSDNGRLKFKNGEVEYIVKNRFAKEASTTSAPFRANSTTSSDWNWSSESDSFPTENNVDGKTLYVSGIVDKDGDDYVINPTMMSTNEGNITTGVENIVVDAANGEAIYYNLNGVRVDNPANGLYIRVVNGNATKVMIK